MGEVSEATDPNLKRAVAIKVLPAAVSNDPERLARFQREGEVLGALNHPRIAQIHGLEKSDIIIALVMVLVEGPTVADRMAQGAIPMMRRCRSPGRSLKPLRPHAQAATMIKEDADYGSDPTQDTENGRRGDGDGRSAGRVCCAD